MKKEFLLLLFLFAFISCEQNDGLDYLDSSNIENMPTAGIKSRATQNIADFDPIKELENIPVNIMNVGNNSYLVRKKEIKLICIKKMMEV